MSNDRKCQAGCGHAQWCHVSLPSPFIGEACSACDGLNAHHPFETVESLRAEVTALRERLNGVLNTSVCTKCGWVGVPVPHGGGFARISWICGRCTYEVPAPKSAKIESWERTVAALTEARASEMALANRCADAANTYGGHFPSCTSEISKISDCCECGWSDVQIEIDRVRHRDLSPDAEKHLAIRQALEQQIRDLTAERDEAKRLLEIESTCSTCYLQPQRTVCACGNVRTRDAETEGLRQLVFDLGNQNAVLRKEQLTDEALTAAARALCTSFMLDRRFIGFIEEAVVNTLRAARGSVVGSKVDE